MNQSNNSPTPTINAWTIAGVNPAQGLLSLMRDHADDYLTSYRTDLEVRDRELLVKAHRGEVIWVLRPSGTDLFCRSLLTDPKTLRYAAIWMSAVAQDKDARFFAGRLGKHGGLICKISRDEAIERMGRWVFEIAK